jgi:hypothetical protein
MCCALRQRPAGGAGCCCRQAAAPEHHRCPSSCVRHAALATSATDRQLSSTGACVWGVACVLGAVWCGVCLCARPERGQWELQLVCD